MRTNGLILLLSVGIISILGFLVYKKTSFFKTPFSVQTEMTDQGVILDIENTSLGKKKYLCDKYQFIEVYFQGELGEKLKIVRRCLIQKNRADLADFEIPFLHMFSFSPQSGEFTTDVNTKIYLTNHQKRWSKKWNLIQILFFNSETSFELQNKNITLDLEHLLKAGSK
ncbi:MAG: hypothetical protein A2622_06915 [Bdellovibrionales bacterium RIFCSPHIGHO2_01_FULL_40_29]|nr:MAG: hypothetical protein A2622_06915 [Bdellovibrionales bacterium RIFCSPHIGHO2_01_FULL_40_29]OFZ35170.1 MAG: hypothetical protein A3D17_07265 [Bdellovibrionales bacterium RIFCSPHIGHO2_02_FULL_40_15]